LIFLDFFEPQTIFIGEWGTKFIFLISNGQKNDQIYIQTIRFEFKRINQKLITHYRPPAPVAAVVRVVPPGSTPVRTISPSLNGCYPYRPVPLPYFPEWAVPSDQSTIGTGLMGNCKSYWKFSFSQYTASFSFHTSPILDSDLSLFSH
jgi:hypothetical protein